MATIRDVAKLAGVSTTTVSHVLNKTRFVSAEGKAKVENAVMQLNYVPNIVARSLKGGSSRVLGMLVTDSNNPFYADLIQWVDQVAYRHGYNLILCNTQGNRERAKDYMSMLSQRRVDGMLMMSSDARQLPVSSYGTMPMVMMDSGPERAGYDRILDDSEQGGYMATKHLLAAGHRSIGLLAGPLEKSNSQNRIAGYRRAMAEANADVDEGWIQSGEFTYEGGVTAMTELLKQQKTVTAVFASNDLMAMGAIRVAGEHGLTIPQDLSMIGYDDIPGAKYFNPPLTTMRQPLELMAEQAIAMLLARMETPEREGQRTLLTPTLIIRDSVANC
ncbi:substrate-binding domain-containing protein [Shewanella sp. D64]|uniref:LacI family DNA-binding transcriptional regulator n=1 Tax=unclassified Shewanella TaxID=196818 RepID=UPI0022BA1423|nr:MULTISPECIES: substrate-binding domain-containing protein [unclassified Shewanella]MEC4727537.1 substrate-binding domain-containing protein [Shewanella sp. D64]MEC4738054.1 substrate-binding domain-containing protein [Shewanella sp. E94]WBJ96430.1 substrate-binding domain-containing protein [Shewanella sp. MTB7]